MSYWQSKQVLVNGAIGIVGSWLTKELIDQGAFVAAPILDADPQSELFRRSYIHCVAVVNGRLEEIDGGLRETVQWYRDLFQDRAR